MSVGRFVLLTDILGVVFVALALVACQHWPWPLPPHPVPGSPTAVLICAISAAIGQIVVVRVRHGATYEELGFYEVVIAAGLCLMPPSPLLVSVLAGLLIAEVAVRREPIKIAFNLGSYATASSVMVVVYLFLNGQAEPVQLRMVVAMFVALVVFEAVNLLLMAELLHRFNAADVDRRDVVRDEWALSGFMAVGGVGVGLVAVALWMNAPALLPFVALPVAALRYAYGATADHANARERNRWLIRLGGVLARRERAEATLADGVQAIKAVFGAPHARVALPDTGTAVNPADAALMHSLAGTADPRPLAPAELPKDWTSGTVVALDVGAPEPGALLLGSTEPYRRSLVGRNRGWALEDSDRPVLGALVSALGSSVRAGRAYDALAEETAKLTAVVDNTSDGIAVVDDTGQVLLWSQTMARMTGVAEQTLTVAEPADHPEVVRTMLGASEAGPGTHVHLVRPDGEELDVMVSSVRVGEAGGAGEADGGWVSILTVHDETRERRVERMKTDFVATISHELRTPITPIKGYAHLLATRGDRIPPAKRQAALQTISDRADHLTRLVDDLLLASRVSDGARLAVEIAVEDLGEVIATAVGTFPALSSRIRVRPLAAPVAVQCDRVRAVQCLSNLIGNAEKYTPAGTWVDIWVEVRALQAAVHVRDHGPGIPASEQARVFERFYRIEDPFTMKTGGAGLGLHIARELAIAMGGGLELVTPDGDGAEFVLYLPTTDAPPVGGTRESGSDADVPPRPGGAGPWQRPDPQDAPTEGAGRGGAARAAGAVAPAAVGGVGTPPSDTMGPASARPRTVPLPAESDGSGTDRSQTAATGHQ